MKQNERNPTFDEEVQALLKTMVPLSPAELAEQKRRLEQDFPKLTASQKARQRWQARPIVVVIQDAERAQAVLLQRLGESNPFCGAHARLLGKGRHHLVL
jgi:hypothetical protein